MDLKEVRCDILDWIHQAQARAKKQALVVMNLWIPQNVGNFLTNL